MNVHSGVKGSLGSGPVQTFTEMLLSEKFKSLLGYQIHESCDFSSPYSSKKGKQKTKLLKTKPKSTVHTCSWSSDPPKNNESRSYFTGHMCFEQDYG